MKSFTRTAIVLTFAAAAACSAPAVRASGEAPAKPADTVTTFWALPKDADSVTLLAAGQDKPVTVAVQAGTTLGGACHECSLPLRFKPADAAKRCSACPCPFPASRCIAWKALKPDGWAQMLEALPKGTGLRAVYNEAGKPESGLKSLIVDRKVILLPVDGLASMSAGDLAKLVKPVAGAKAELMADGKQMLVTLKEDWNQDKETALEKALAKAGAKLTFASAAEPAPAH